MRKKTILVLLMAFLFTSFLSTAWKISPANAPPGGVVWTVPSGPTPTLQAAVALAGSNDEIHVLAGHFEILAANLVITQPNLWIIGAPLNSGPTPTIDLAGFTIVIMAPNVFIWGLEIWDSIGTPVGIVLIGGSSFCTIMNNTIIGLSPASIGIQVQTPHNTIALNTMGFWGTCIDLATPPSIGNTVLANTFGWVGPYIYGINVSMGAGFNSAYWNNLWSPIELNDNNPPASPPNWFDDTTGGGPGWNKGNFEITWAIPPPYLVPPGTNGYWDNWPLVAPISMILGDLNLDGQVSLADITILAQNYRRQWCQLLWDPRIDIAPPYGRIDLTDLVTLATNYNKNL